MGLDTFDELVGSIAETTGAVREAVGAMRREDLGRRPSNEDWSALEHVCHLRDIEREGYAVRIEKILAEDQPFLPDLDGDKLAAERDYIRQQFDEALLAFVEAREGNVRRLRGLSDEQTGRGATFEHVGAIRLADLVRMMGEHDREHIKQLGELRDRLSG